MAAYIQNLEPRLVLSATVAIAATDPDLTEPVNGPATDVATFTVTRANDAFSQFDMVMVNYQFTGLANQSWNTDFTASLDGSPMSQSGMIMFMSGDPLTKTITLAAMQDGWTEGNETFTLTLSNPWNATLGQSSATATIHEIPPTVSVAALMPTTSEPASLGGGTSPGTFRISRAGNTMGSLIVEFTLGGSATPGAAAFNDYALSVTGGGGSLQMPSGGNPGQVTIPAGQSFIDLLVTPNYEPQVEGNETVVLTLVDATNPAYDLGAGTSATVTIDDLPAPAFTVTPPATNAIEEGDQVTVSVSTQAVVTTWWVDWGNGMGPQSYPGGGNPPSGSLLTAVHVYEDDNPTATASDDYEITITAIIGGVEYDVTDDPLTLTVNNVAPVVTPFTLSVVSQSTQATLQADFTDEGTITESWTYAVNWGDGTPVALPSSATGGTVNLNHVYTAAGDYTVTFTLTDDDGGTATKTGQITIDGIEITGYVTQYLDEDGEWQTVGEEEPVWADDSLRWVADWQPTYGDPDSNDIDHVDWQYRPWDQPQASWTTFATSVGDGPATGNPGTGLWAIRAVAHLVNGLLAEGIVRRLADVEILSVEWVPAEILGFPIETDLRGEWNEAGSELIGRRFFPDATEPGGSMQKSVGIKVTVTPTQIPITVFLKLYDVDDPSSSFAPIDDDGGPGSVNAPDNYGDMPDLADFVEVDGSKVVTMSWGANATPRPGDNFRVVASIRPQSLEKIKPMKQSADMKLFHDANGDDVWDFDESFTETKTGIPVRASLPLTVWRQLHVYYGSMGAVTGNRQSLEAIDVDTSNPDRSIVEFNASAGDLSRFEHGTFRDSAGHTFDILAWNLTEHTITVENYLIDGTAPVTGVGILTDDDFLQDGQDVPMPDMSGAQRAFNEAFVDVLLIDYAQLASEQIPFLLNAEGAAAIAAIDYWPGSSIRPQNSDAFWVTFVVGSFQAQTWRDFDADEEPGGGVMGRAYLGHGAMVFLETIRDESRINGWNSSARERDVVVHELGHMVSGLDHVWYGDAVTHWGHHLQPPPGSPQNSTGPFSAGSDLLLQGATFGSEWYPRFVDRYLVGIRQANKPDND